MSHRPTKPSSPWKTLSFYFFPFDLAPHLLFFHLFPPLIETLSLIWFQNPHHVAGLFSFPSCVQRKMKRYRIEIVTDRSLTVKMLILNTLIGQKECVFLGWHNSLLLNMSNEILVKVTVFQSEMNHVSCNPLCMYEIDEETEIIQSWST